MIGNRPPAGAASCMQGLRYIRLTKNEGINLDLPTMASLKLKFQSIHKEIAMQFHLDNMTCGGCARTVTRAIQSVDPEASIITDPASHFVEIQTSVAKEKIVAALSEEGFSPREE